MKGSTCLFSPSAALLRVFLSGTAPRHAGLLASRNSDGDISGRRYSSGNRYKSGRPVLLVPQFLAPQAHALVQTSVATSYSSMRHAPQQLGTLLQRRCFQKRTPPRRPPISAMARPASRPPSASLTSNGGGGGGSRSRGKASTPQAKYRLNRLPRDNEITQRYVILRNEDGTLSEPQITANVLATLNGRTESLVVVAMPSGVQNSDGDAVDDLNSDNSSSKGDRGGNAPKYPICKVVDRVAERQAEAERAKEQRKKHVSVKELELNWAIDLHDLTHRLSKLREFLEKGLRVEVLLLRKSKGRPKKHVTKEEAAEVVRRVRETVAAVPGAKETKNMEGELLRTVKIVAEGPAKTGKKQTEDEGNDGE